MDFKDRAYWTYENMSSTRQRDVKVSTPVETRNGMNEDITEEGSVFIFAQMDTFEISLNSVKVGRRSCSRACYHRRTWRLYSKEVSVSYTTLTKG